MAQLPIYKSEDQTLELIQTKWSSLLNPLLAKPVSLILKNVVLKNGATTINHKLGRRLAGWKTTRVRASAIIFDEQDSNQTPDLTLVLVSNAAVTVDIEVF